MSNNKKLVSEPHYLIRLRAEVECNGPESLTPTQRAAMIAYKDAATCKREYQEALARERDYMMRHNGYVDAHILAMAMNGLPKKPHAVLQCDVRGYAVYHHPGEKYLGMYIDCCSPEDYKRAAEALGDENKWYITRYDNKETYWAVRGFW